LISILKERAERTPCEARDYTHYAPGVNACGKTINYNAHRPIDTS